MVLQAQPRRKFLKSVGLVGAAALSAPYVTRIARAAAPEGATEGLRSKIDHIVVLFQENRSFDHYFGVYKNPAGAMVTNLLDPDGRVDTRFTGLQKNPAGIPYNWLPVPEDIPGFELGTPGQSALPSRAVHTGDPQCAVGSGAPFLPHDGPDRPRTHGPVRGAGPEQASCAVCQSLCKGERSAPHDLRSIEAFGRSDWFL